MRIKVDKSKCTGCLVCEIECSQHNAGIVQPKSSAIRVRLADLTADGFNEPIVCRQCDKMVCLGDEAKDYDAEEAAKYYWDNLNRMKSCPFGALFVYHKRVIHCNLCGGDPGCVKVCPTGAIFLDRG